MPRELFFGLTAVKEIRLSGTVIERRGKDEFGNFTLNVTDAGLSSLNLVIGAESRNEERSGTPDLPECSESFRGKTRQLVQHNCWIPTNGWFPLIAIQTLGSGFVSSGTGSRVTLKRPVRAKGEQLVIDLVEAFSRFSLDVDAETHLPSRVSFAVHPEDDSISEIPVEIRYSDYREAAGARLPYKIEKRVNGTIVLDLTITDAQVQR